MLRSLQNSPDLSCLYRSNPPPPPFNSRCSWYPPRRALTDYASAGCLSFVWLITFDTTTSSYDVPFCTPHIQAATPLRLLEPLSVEAWFPLRLRWFLRLSSERPWRIPSGGKFARLPYFRSPLLLRSAARPGILPINGTVQRYTFLLLPLPSKTLCHVCIGRPSNPP